MNPHDNSSKTISRAAAIVIHHDAVLLMYRERGNEIYYAFPGGTVEPSETTQDAAIRELAEETSIEAHPIRLLYHLHVMDNERPHTEEYFYWCDYISGTPSLQVNSIEYTRMNDANFYQPLWIPLNKLKNLLIYPLEIRDTLIADIANGFSSNVKKIFV